MVPGYRYHIYNRANGAENLFRTPENYRYFLQQWQKYISPVAQSLVYCLMPNHFHFLVRIREEKELEEFANKKFNKDLTGFENLSGLISKQFSNLFNSYSKAFNKMYGRNGSLFQRPFKSKEIDSDEYFTTVILYIHQNPIHHGFTNDMKKWPYCSYNAILNGDDTFINRTEIIDLFGSKDEFINIHLQELERFKELESWLT